MTRALDDLMAEGRLYFAYGSNLDLAQMARRCGAPLAVGIASLPDVELAFVGRSALWEGKGVATLRPAPGRCVPGVLYVLGEEDVEKLDGWEGCPDAYEHEEVVVRDEEGRDRRAFVYSKRSGASRPNAPGPLYLGVLLREYRRLGFDTAPLEAAARIGPGR
jgi:hypothetical protein